MMEYSTLENIFPYQLVCYFDMAKFEFNHRFYAIRANMNIDLVNCGPHPMHVLLTVFTLHSSKTKCLRYLENMAY